MVRPPNGRLLRASCCVMLLAPSLAEPLLMSRYEGPRHSAPVDPAMLVEARVFACEQRLDKERRNFFERNLQPVRAGKTAVDLAVDVEDGIALRHRADALQVEGLCPDGVEGENRDDEGERERDEEKRQGPNASRAGVSCFRAAVLRDPVRAKNFIAKC